MARSQRQAKPLSKPRTTRATLRLEGELRYYSSRGAQGQAGSRGKNAKPQGITKSKPKIGSYGSKTTQKSKRKGISKKKSDKPFPLLDLPAELRNNIYEKVLENQPKVYLSKRTRGNLASQSALARVSRQVRNEFLPVMYLCAGEIIASVQNFDFRHIVTFLNRLSDKEMTALVETPSSRKMKIELTFTSSFRSNRFSEEFALLHRWINRLEHPTKRGTKIDATYVVVEYNGKADYSVFKFAVISGWSQEKRTMDEARKIRKAIHNWELSALRLKEIAIRNEMVRRRAAQG